VKSGTTPVIHRRGEMQEGVSGDPIQVETSRKSGSIKLQYIFLSHELSAAPLVAHGPREELNPIGSRVTTP